MKKEYPDFDPDKNSVMLSIAKSEFLKKKPEAIDGKVTLGGILHRVTYTDNDLEVILTPMQQISKLN